MIHTMLGRCGAPAGPADRVAVSDCRSAAPTGEVDSTDATVVNRQRFQIKVCGAIIRETLPVRDRKLGRLMIRVDPIFRNGLAPAV